MTDEEKVRHASQVQNLLAQPAFQWALARRREQITTDWAATEPGESDRREELHRELRALAGVEGALGAALNDGRAAEGKINRRS